MLERSGENKHRAINGLKVLVFFQISQRLLRVVQSDGNATEVARLCFVTALVDK